MDKRVDWRGGGKIVVSPRREGEARRRGYVAGKKSDVHDRQEGKKKKA